MNARLRHMIRPGLAGVVAAAVAIAATAMPALADPPPWEPMSPPVQIVGRVDVLTLAIDASGSMREGQSLSPRARAAGRHAIADAEPCSYVVIATFGSDARVVGDRFACTDHDRQVLLDSVEAISMNADRTDVHVLETLLGHVRDAVAARYAARGFHMEAQILTDGQPDPIDRSETQSFDVLLEQRTTRTELGGGLWLYRLSFDGAAPSPGTAVATATSPVEPVPRPAESEEGLTGRPGPELRVMPQLDALPIAPPRANEPADAHVGRVALIASITILALLAGAFLVARRRAGREAEAALTAAETPDGPRVVPLKNPAGIKFTEWSVSPKGERAPVNGPLAVRYTPNRPLTLGADEARVVVPLRSAGISGRLASITLDGRGNGVVAPLNGAAIRFDGQDVQRAMTFCAEHSHVLSAGATEVHIEPASVLSESEDALYHRLAHHGAEDGAEDTEERGNGSSPTEPVERETALRRRTP